MRQMNNMAERDTYKYHLKKGRKVVHRDITYDLERREAQHQADNPGSHVVQIGRRTTHAAALAWVCKGGKRDRVSRVKTDAEC